MSFDRATTIDLATPGTNLSPNVDNHFVQFFENDEQLAHSVARFIGAGLCEGAASVVIATAPHLVAVEATLADRGMNVEALKSSGRLLVLDAAQTLESLMGEAIPDKGKFETIIGGHLKALTSKYTKVYAYAEMVHLLWSAGNVAGSQKLEQFWSAILTQYPCALLRAGSRQMLEQKGDLQGALAFHLELKRREKAEAALRETQSFNDIILESSPDCIKILSLDGKLLYMNKGGLVALEIEALDPIKGSDYLSFWNGDDRQNAHRALEAAKAGGTSEFVGYFPTTRTKQPRWWHVAIKPLRDTHGRITRLLAISRDITQSRQAQEEKFRLIVENVKDYAIFMLDSSGHVSTWNAGAKRIKGYDSSEIIGSHFSRFYTSEDIARNHPANELEYAEKNGDYEEEGWRVRKDGSRFWANVVITALRDSEGQLKGFAKVTRDLTERKLAERARENERAAFLAEASNVLGSSLDYRQTLSKLAHLAVPALADWCTITILNDDGTQTRVAIAHNNPAKSEFAEELSKYYPADASESSGVGNVIRTGKTLYMPTVDDTQLVAAAKDARHLELMRQLGCCSSMVVPITARGKILGAIAILSSTQNRRYSESDLALAEDLGRRAGIAIDNALLYDAAQKAISARDEFLSIASHELKTPLTTLKLQAQMRSRDVKKGDYKRFDPERLPKMLYDDERQINRLNRLVDDMLDVSRVQSGKLSFSAERFDLSEMVRDTIARMSDQIEAKGSSVSLETSGEILGSWDRFRIEQVFVNLITNALKYGAGQPVTVKVTRDADQAVLRVSDQGIGIAKEDQGRIFDQFERAVSGNSISGLGLGLYISKKIVEAHGGALSVESELGHGSTFTLSLPLIGAS